MAYIDKVLEGKFINMRSVTVADSEFIVKLRSDPEKYKYIHPPVDGYCVDMQNKWLEKQRATEGDYYFIFEDKDGNRLGTCGFVGVNGDECENGRWVSCGNAIQNVESQILNYDFIFHELGLKKVRFYVTKTNKTVVNFHKQFGSEYIRDADYDGFPSVEMLLTAENYERTRSKVMNMLAHVSE